MRLQAVLRLAAVAIAVLGVIDPAVMLARKARHPLVIATDDAHGASPVSVARLRGLLEEDYDVRVRPIGVDRRLPACGADESCVLVGGERWPRGTIDSGARIMGAIRLEPMPRARVAIDRVTSPTTTHARAVGSLLVDLTGHDVTGAESTIDVLDGNVPVGHAVHRWDADGHVTIPVDWWPVGSGPRVLSVRASQSSGDATSGGGHLLPGSPARQPRWGGFRGAEGRDQVDLGVEVATTPYNALVYDTRPSWTSTFVRRAIEGDSRLALRVVAGVSPRVQVTEGAPFRLDAATLTDASAVIIGAPEALSVRDVDMLERFVRVRGGSLIVVPDRRPSGPIVRLLPSPMTERLEPAPVQVGDWRASELLLFPKPAGGHEILASAGADAAVLVAPSGAGRIVVSGAMDAWRYRDAENAAFDRAWRSLIADAAAAGGRPLEVTLDRGIVRPADEVRVTARVRAMAAADAAVAVSATVACGDEPPRVLRLWPTGDRRRFEGRFAPGPSGACRIAVSSSAPVVATQTASLLVSPDFHSRAVSSKGSVPPQLTNDTGARVFAAGDETSLARAVRRLSAADRAPTEVRLMRSPWWIVPFAGCLGVEWWLRRRRGMR